MSKKTNGVNWSRTPQHTFRRQGALARLENQLKIGKKTTGDGELHDLTEKDIKRINKEITTLKERIARAK